MDSSVLLSDNGSMGIASSRDHRLVRLSDAPNMELTKEQQQLRERFVLSLIETTIRLKKGSTDPEVTLDLLIQAADLLKQHLLKEREELREEQD
jgi:hemerythrin-like domain-containing protein